MTTAVQHRRGTTAEHSTFTGLEGEVTIDTTKDTAVIHDGALAGGYPLAKENLNNANPSTLGALDGASSAADDLFLVYDTSASQMKKMTRAELNNAIVVDAMDTVDINGGTIDGTAIGSASASTGAFTTLTSSSTVTLNGGTANGVAYLNGSKVLTTGSALTFDGTNLGIGTSTPARLLDVWASGSGMLAVARFLAKDGATSHRLEIDVDDTNNLVQLASTGSSSGGFTFLTGTSERLRITSSGNVGIGTSSPTNALSVSGNANITGNTTLGDASTDTVTVNGYMGVGVAPSSSNALTVSTAASRAGRFIRTTVSPSSSTYALEVDNTAQTGNMTAAGAFNIATSTKANAFTINGNGDASFAGNVTLGDASTDTVTVNGYMGVGGAGSSTAGIFVQNNALTGTAQVGCSVSVVGTSASTTSVRAFSARPGTANASFTVADAIAYNVVDAAKGASSTITNLHGVYINDQTQGTNNYGITSLVSSGTNKWNIYASGTAANYFAGNVGIGTSSPNGKVEITNTNTGDVLALQLSNSNGAGSDSTTLRFRNSTLSTSGSGGAEISALRDAANNGSSLLFKTATSAGAITERLRIDSSGALIAKPAAGTGAVFNEDGVDADFRVESDTNTHALFVEGSSGNVGIGTNTPTVRLQVSSATASQIYATDTTSGNTAQMFASSAGAVFGSFTNAVVQIRTNNAERLRITSAGNVGIGTSSPTEMLDINSDAIRIRTAQTPASATATGNAGDICWDANYVYVCVATNTWKRAALSTW